MAVVSFLVLPFDDDSVVDGLHGDFRWLEVVDIDARLESVLPEVEVLLVLDQFRGGFTGQGPRTTVA
jgi:hypothetical protein